MVNAIDWDPRSEAVLADQIAAYDGMRGTCPVAHSAYGNWSVFRHADVVAILEDHETYSSAVSSHLSVPNSMDPPVHTAYREIVDRYFTPELVAAFEPDCRRLARRLVAGLPEGEVELMADLCEPFASQVQCAFMGWPESLHQPLQEWTKANHAATLAMDREAMADVAVEFDGYITAQLEEHRTASESAVTAEAGPADPTSRLLRETLDGRPLTDEEIVSIVRNWTVGELATIAASVGILTQYLAAHPDIQSRLRADQALLPAGIDEILRLHAPLIANRRRTTHQVTISGRDIPSAERVMVLWASANRDEAVFGDPDEFRLDRDPELNLLYGRGIHACPGAPLARLELRVMMEELLARTTRLEMAPGRDPVRARFPGSGFDRLPLLVS
jgi:cytochrome P450